jgi:hypothetical protein
MPTLDDAPTIPKLTGANLTGATNPAETPTTLDELDLIQVYDVSERKVKTITIANFAAALNIALD